MTITAVQGVGRWRVEGEAEWLWQCVECISERGTNFYFRA